MGSRDRVLREALDVHAVDVENGGCGYSLIWFAEIADRYPAALAKEPRLVAFLDGFRVQRRAYIRGKRDFTVGYSANPYCAYVDGAAHDAWMEGWNDAASVADRDV